MRLALFLVGLGLVTGCSATGEETAASSNAAAATEAPTLDCDQIGSFPEAAMLGIGDGTYVRAGAAPSNSLQSFKLGPLEDIAGWGGKNAAYTRDVAAPCWDIVAAGDGSSLSIDHPIPMTSAACADQQGTITVLADNPAIGAFVSFKDAANLPLGNDTYWVTGSQLDANGKVSAMCLSSAVTGERFLMRRQ